MGILYYIPRQNVYNKWCQFLNDPVRVAKLLMRRLVVTVEEQRKFVAVVKELFSEFSAWTKTFRTPELYYGPLSDCVEGNVTVLAKGFRHIPKSRAKRREIWRKERIEGKITRSFNPQANAKEA